VLRVLLLLLHLGDLSVEAVSVPERPLLKPWYRLARADGRIALEYGHHVVCLEGRAAERLLPALLPLLDGTRTLDDVTSQLGTAVTPAVENALRILSEHGVLTEGPPLAELPAPFAAAAEAAAARGGVSPDAARKALAAARVSILGESAVASEVARLLLLGGVGHVERAGWDELQSASLVVAAPEPFEAARLGGWNRVALRESIAWLAVLPFDGRLAAVGPLFVPPDTCCYECYRLRRASNSGYLEEFAALEEVATAAPQDPAFLAVVAGVAVSVAVRRLSFEDPFATGIFYAVEHEARFVIEPHHVYRVPRCPACSDAATTGPPVPWGDV
jgi:bacteriocin biosynthesis cyclodehydratase domain-containing protein